MEKIVSGVWGGIVSVSDGSDSIPCSVFCLIRCQNLLQCPSVLQIHRKVIQQFHLIPELPEPIIIPASVGVQGLQTAIVCRLLCFVSVERGVVEIHGRCLNCMYIKRFCTVCRGLVPVGELSKSGWQAVGRV